MSKVIGSQFILMTIFYMKVSIFAYCSYPPDNPEEEDESNMANDQLIKLCNQDFFPTKNLHKRATSLLNYKEPKIPATKLRRLKERYRLNTCVPSSSSAPIERLLTINTVT